MSTEVLIPRLAVIGVGLIGGSLARALKRAQVVGEVVGCGRNVEQLERAVALGVIDRYTDDPAAAVAGADMVVVGTPVSAMRAVFGAIRDHLAPHAVLTDVGSAKGCVVADAEAVFGTLPERFVPGHPVAGTEKSGVEASFAELFERRRVILTPHVESAAEAVDRVRAMWQATGAEVVEMGIRHHDEVLAATSHLPHVLAYTVVDTLASMDDRAEIFRFAAGGFRDFTRISSSDPAMWRDICLANRECLVEVIDEYIGTLTRLREALARGDERTVFETFRRAKHARDNFYRE
ncbi:prephenate dehydrogenase [Plasticicumulans lactativorans]|uniref:prephenate dehydrogenase n=1 Tax=Plasticicumulans lactativorans TaxID=1133106 RepID=A0A4R2LFP0_9GAMM|nr:prephenate dehydrogenase [Plasticicumulans lactativorans]